MMASIFDAVQGGSSSTAETLYRYPDADALDFVNTYADTQIKGEASDGWWFNFNHTLEDYVDDKGSGWPEHGIIVNPNGHNHLVWFDTTGRLVVIDLTGYEYEQAFVNSVKKPEVMADPQYLELWQATIDPLVPKIPDIKYILFLVLGIGVVFLLIKNPSQWVA